MPERCLITHPAALKPYESDGLTAVRQVPWLVALPEGGLIISGIVGSILLTINILIITNIILFTDSCVITCFVLAHTGNLEIPD